jgi:hypothetical protein
MGKSWNKGNEESVAVSRCPQVLRQPKKSLGSPHCYQTRNSDDRSRYLQKTQIRKTLAACSIGASAAILIIGLLIA